MDNSVCAQTAADMEKLKAWLSTYPYWDDCMQVDFTQVRPGFSGLLPKGAEETSRREDVLGNRMVGCRYHFTLFWQMTGQGDDGEDAGRLLDFQGWVREQSVLDLAPRFGDVPALERIRAEKGGLTLGTQTVTYTVTLIADFMKVYEVK